MKETIELINQWAAFKEIHENAGIEDFCRYTLIKKREKIDLGSFLGAKIPPRTDIVLIKLLTKLNRLSTLYSDLALKDIGVKNKEEFLYLVTIYNFKEPIKTEVIYNLLTELSTGLNILSNLKESGLIKEKVDLHDKRSKRVILTSKGEKVLHACFEKIIKVNKMLLKDVPEEDMLLCIQLLKTIDINYSSRWQKDREKPFEEIYESIMGEKEKDPKE